jgi:hypothetical protein
MRGATTVMDGGKDPQDDNINMLKVLPTQIDKFQSFERGGTKKKTNLSQSRSRISEGESAT